MGTAKSTQGLPSIPTTIQTGNWTAFTAFLNTKVMLSKEMKMYRRSINGGSAREIHAFISELPFSSRPISVIVHQLDWCCPVLVTLKLPQKPISLSTSSLSCSVFPRNFTQNPINHRIVSAQYRKCEERKNNLFLYSFAHLKITNYSNCGEGKRTQPWLVYIGCAMNFLAILALVWSILAQFYPIAPQLLLWLHWNPIVRNWLGHVLTALPSVQC